MENNIAPGITYALNAARVKTPVPNIGYTGHGANTGGLQQHSVGELYPFISVVSEEHGRCLLDSRTDQEVRGIANYDEMVIIAHFYKTRSLMVEQTYYLNGMTITL